MPARVLIKGPGPVRLLASALIRIASAVLTLWLASLLVFLLLDVLPGDPAQVALGLEATPQTLAALRQELGLSDRLSERYLDWILGFMHFDLGISTTYRIPVLELVHTRLSLSLPLAGLALLMTLSIGFPLGFALYRGSLPLTIFSALLLATPNFILAFLLILGFSLSWSLFPAGGFSGWGQPIQALYELILPAFSLAVSQSIILARLTARECRFVLQSDYIIFAQANGLSALRAFYQHGLGNIIVGCLPLIGLQFGFLVAGVVIIELIFQLPGIGQLLFEAIANRDFTVVSSLIMILLSWIIFMNTLVDLLLLLLDPRLSK